MVVSLRGLSRRGRRSYKKCLGMRTAEEPSPMRWAPTKKPISQRVREKLTEGVSSLSSLLQQRQLSTQRRLEFLLNVIGYQFLVLP